MLLFWPVKQDYARFHLQASCSKDSKSEKKKKKLQDFYLNMADLWLDKLLMFCIFSACSCLHSGVPFAVLIQDGASVVTAVCPPGRLVFRIYLQP